MISFLFLVLSLIFISSFPYGTVSVGIRVVSKNSTSIMRLFSF